MAVGGTMYRTPTPEKREGFSQPVIGSIPTIIRTFKAAVTRKINLIPEAPVSAIWQRSYYEHVIRDDGEMNVVCEYIAANPLRWLEDQKNPNVL